MLFFLLPISLSIAAAMQFLGSSIKALIPANMGSINQLCAQRLNTVWQLSLCLCSPVSLWFCLWHCSWKDLLQTHSSSPPETHIQRRSSTSKHWETHTDGTHICHFFLFWHDAAINPDLWPRWRSFYLKLYCTCHNSLSCQTLVTVHYALSLHNCLIIIA